MTFPLLTSGEQADLVARIERGDSEAEARLVELYAKAIRAMVRIRTRGAVDDQDVSQEVLMTAITAIRKGQLREAERLGAFVAGITRNIINNQLRVQASRPMEPLASDDVAVADLRDEVSKRERMALLRAALEEIGADDRRILLLTLVEGLKPGEIAKKLTMDPDVVRQRKSRAIRKLTDRLKGN